MFVVKLSRQKGASAQYPGTVAAAGCDLVLQKPVTILCGDNGCGKTTLLELLAAKTNAVRIGNQKNGEKQALIASAARGYRLSRLAHERASFYFSAEDFIKYVEWQERSKAEMREELARVDEEYVHGSYAWIQARSAFSGELSAMENMYARSLTHSSHGEGFYAFFKSRIAPGGLYLLDEPEAALSLPNQYALALLIRDGVKDGCQFVISTHSPVLSGIPEAEILEIKNGEINPTTWENMESISFVKMFLARR